MEKRSSSKIFQELVNATSYKDKDYTKLISLTNMTFFLGAGFSKSWDNNYPTGQELFSFLSSIHKWAREHYNIIPFEGTFNQWVNEIIEQNK